MAVTVRTHSTAQLIGRVRLVGESLGGFKIGVERTHRPNSLDSIELVDLGIAGARNQHYLQLWWPAA